MGTKQLSRRLLIAALLGSAPVYASAASPAELQAQFEAAARAAEQGDFGERSLRLPR